MAALKTGTVTYRRDLSPYLAIFRIMPENGSTFPSYKAGQYIALRRNNCKLTKRVIHPDGKWNTFLMSIPTETENTDM